ncbi:MAG TPA: site-2 protease family protein [candidate division Zixibacteria bacterium]|nr:site-2 protease family protein [candidate division Zixibacteria bacterium]
MLFLRAEPAQLIAILLALVVGLTFHEFSHAWVADQLGDRRPRALGRVSLNPLRHLDPMGSIFMLLVGFGWAKPVPVNPYALRPGPVGMSWVAASGPLANLAVAAAFAVVFRALDVAGIFIPFLGVMLFTVVVLNVALALFNLLPIPPLDGYNLVMPLLPPRWQYQVARYAQYGVVVLLLLVALSWSGAFSPLGWLFGLARGIAGLLVGA